MSAVLVVGTQIGSAVAVGFVSALVPLVNAEAAVSAAALGFAPAMALIAAVALAVGQTAGKICVFEVARRGSALGVKRCNKRPPPDWQLRLMKGLDGRWRTNGVVLLAAVAGLPPLLLVSAAAGAMKTRRIDFAVCCLLGRTVRFVAIAAAIVLAW
jgi:membrane protein YqaA with SNARE-associated domain